MKQNSKSPAGTKVQQSDAVEASSVSPTCTKPLVSGSVYKIETLEDLCDVANVDNIDRLSLDLLQWIHHYVDVISKVRKLNPEITIGKKNTEIAKGGFEWHDDGRNDIIGVNVINGETGELKEHRF